MDVCEHRTDHSMVASVSSCFTVSMLIVSSLKIINQIIPTSDRALLILYSTVVYSSGAASSPSDSV